MIQWLTVVRLVGQAGKWDSGVSSFISASLPSYDHMLITRPMSRLEEGEKEARGKVPSPLCPHRFHKIENECSEAGGNML